MLADQFSNWTIALIVVIALMGLFFHVFRYSSRTAEIAPNILTSIGIFGTFLGVAIGLWHFDTADIQSSVPRLMEGLKTAFWSSIAGLFMALTVKIRAVLEQTSRQSLDRPRAASIDDLDQSLQILVAGLVQGDECLKQQLKVNYSKVDERLLSLQEILSTYEERMAEANAKALIQAIEVVMSEFNTKINEQYGDNFKRLNQSVIGMLEWQQQYKQQLTQLIDEEQRAAVNMEQASHAFEYMVKHADAFNGISESLGGLLTALEAQRSQLHGQLTALAGMLNHAADGLPQLEQRITSLTQGVADAVNQQQRWAIDELTTMQTQISEQLQQVVSNSSDHLEAQQRANNQHVQRLGERLERQIIELDTSMEEELNKALRSFGLQLTALSEKFVEDYSPLTDKLQEVVHLAQSIDKRH